MNIFNIKIEFDSDVFCNTIDNYIASKEKAYVCVVDANVLAMAQKDLLYRNIIKQSSINTCDGSSISMMANFIYGTHYSAFNGPDVFRYYIERPFRQVLLGNTKEKVEQIKNIVKSKGINSDLSHLDVPFVSVDDFDYKNIANTINELKPDLIWVSLGAPKQELFMSRIIPYLSSGVMFGIGAAFNFYIGELHNSKKEIGGLRFIWFERLFREPKKQWSRLYHFTKCVPKLFINEYRIAKNHTKIINQSIE